MVRLVLRFGILLDCIGLGYGVCQQVNWPDPVAYESFFRQVARLANLPDGITPNGYLNARVELSPQQAIGLTYAESQALNGESSNCEARIRLLDNAKQAAVLEARLRALESEATSSWLTQRLKVLDKQREQMVLAQIEKLRVVFGDERFRVLDSFVRAKKDVILFFPPVSGTSAIQKK